MDLIAPEVATVSKGGETRIMVELQREVHRPGKEGMTVKLTCKTHPLVEAFMRDLGNGETVEVGAHGRYWVPCDKAKPFRAYDLTTSLELVKAPSGTVLNLERLGQPLSERDGRYEYINLSFLRLVGVSEGAGVSFHIKGVFNTETLKRVRDQITEALYTFYGSYLKPLNLSVIVSTQERT